MTPNPEQQKAIEHQGGVLLKAGAGSGKTYVLVEHIIYLIDQIINNHGSDLELFRIELRAALKKIVLMTFTNKAAGEIKIRLKKRIQGTEGTKHYSIAMEEIDILKATTIHGFFFSLIKEGLAPDIPSELNIVSESKTLTKIESLFDSWLVKQNKNSFIASSIKMKKDFFLKAFQKIFLDPELRLSWENAEKIDLTELFNQATGEICDLNGINSFLINFSKLEDDYSKYETKPWYLYMKEFSEQSFFKITSMKDLNKLFEYIDQTKVPRRPLRKYELYEADAFYDAMATIKDFYKKLGENIEYFMEEQLEVQDYEKVYTSIFDHINNRYFLDRNISFADIEYLVAKAADDQNFLNLVSNRYDYFIIDEFQDTSQIQFEILSRLALHDYKRFFCIGDIKQAIYGFRGGEIGVFLEMEKKVPLVLSLSNNYRSDNDITQFNNQFYQKVLNTGKGFEGKDAHPIKFDEQAVPESKARGNVTKMIVDITGDKGTKLSSSELDAIEAKTLFNKIHAIYDGHESIAILYKKLKPSHELIKLFIQNELSFTAQVKLPLQDDPLIGIFKVFIHLMIKLEKGDHTHLFLINKYLELLDKNTIKDLSWFEKRSLKGFYPLSYLFEDFINDLGVSTSLFQQSLVTIKDIIINHQENLDSIYIYLDSLDNENYSVPFKYGTNPEKIQIMTTHASKGLEFSAVFLGGLYTNGRSMPNTELIGSLPGSFKFYAKELDRKQVTTPVFYFENMLNDIKEFSESKRLLYVATTRAENALFWCDLNLSKIKTSVHKNSWIQAFNNFDSIEFINKEEIGALEVNQFIDKKSKNAPLFHHIDLGILNKPKRNNYILSELSVTGLTSLALCPRMFYFSNILKVKRDELDFLEADKEWPIEIGIEDEMSDHLKSSAERGTKVHADLEYAIKHNFVLPRESAQENKELMWTIDYLKDYKESHNFISEEMVKFKLFDYMISGVPDLILKSISDSDDQIIDFKTGAIKENQNTAYWFQLYCYAYYLFQTDQTKNSITLKLLYTDEKKVLEQNVSFNDVQLKLKNYFDLIQKPDQVNQESCFNCSYGNICQRP